eukprot:830181-Alexandrium_andersonii.AAC.1
MGSSKRTTTLQALCSACPPVAAEPPDSLTMPWRAPPRAGHPDWRTQQTRGAERVGLRSGGGPRGGKPPNSPEKLR